MEGSFLRKKECPGCLPERQQTISTLVGTLQASEFGLAPAATRAVVIVERLGAGLGMLRDGKSPSRNAGDCS